MFWGQLSESVSVYHGLEIKKSKNVLQEAVGAVTRTRAPVHRAQHSPPSGLTHGKCTVQSKAANPELKPY